MPFIHPSDLQRRRKRCRPIIDRLLSLEQETTKQCDICGSEQNAIISNQDRYGLPIRTAMCLYCGLIYSVDRLTPDGNREFYENGDYRRLISEFKGKTQTIQQIRSAQVNYANNLVNLFHGHISPQKGGKLLDVGGSTGIVSREFSRRFGYAATVLDPASLEIDTTRSFGLRAIVGSIEDWKGNEIFDLVLLCRTVEHLFGLRKALERIHSLLEPEGAFYCDIADFVEVCRREGPPEATTKIDHAYWLTQETAPRIFRSLGFETVSIHTTLHPDQVGFLLRAVNPSDLQPVSQTWIQAQIRRFREIETDWHMHGSRPLDAWDWLRKNAYKIRKRVSS